MVRQFAAGLAVAALLAAPAAAQMEVVEQVLVKVNGDIVTQGEFEQRQILTLQQRPELANAPAGSPLIAQAVAEVTPDLILDAVDELLLVQRGREMGYALGDDQFNEIVDGIQEDNNLTDDAEFQAALLEQGLTMADLRRQLERQMLVTRVQQDDIFARLVVTDEEARAYYEANLTQFTTPVTLTLREILIAVETTEQGINVAADNEAAARAEAARARALAGEPFVDLVGELSEAPSAASGGLIGPLAYGDLAAPLQSVIDGLQVGGVTDVLRVQRGYQILKLESRTQPRVITFEEARDNVVDRVAQAKSGLEMARYLERLRLQATITWQNDELREAYESALASRRQQFDLSVPGQPAPVEAGN